MEIDDGFVEHVNTFSRKMHYLKSASAEALKSSKDIIPEFDKLRLKLGERLKDYYTEKFKQFKTSKANLQTHQSVFLKTKDLFRFLVDLNPDMAAEVRNIYVSCIGIIELIQFLLTFILLHFSLIRKLF